MRPSIGDQCRSLRGTILVVLAVTACLVAMVVGIHLWKGIPVGDLTRDPVALFAGRVYVGFVSQLGLFMWAATVAVCLFTARITRGRPGLEGRRRFLVVSALLTAYLLVDDAFLLHEEVYPRLGIPEKLVYGSYIGLVLLWLVRSRAVILATEFVLLVLSLACFATSVAIDAFEPPLPGFFLWEDGFKVCGILFWLAYFVRVAAATARADGSGPAANAPPD
ncbi:MAG: hypothetical protein R3F30_01425 [Planctomycetota bacterium]